MYSMTVRVVVQLYGPLNMPRDVNDEHQDYAQSLALLKSDVPNVTHTRQPCGTILMSSVLIQYSRRQPFLRWAS